MVFHMKCNKGLKWVKFIYLYENMRANRRTSVEHICSVSTQRLYFYFDLRRTKSCTLELKNMLTSKIIWRQISNLRCLCKETCILRHISYTLSLNLTFLLSNSTFSIRNPNLHFWIYIYVTLVCWCHLLTQQRRSKYT